jgi:predicted porin
MNKKLLVLAVGSALAATAGVASADVSWYGKANMSIASSEIAANTQNADGDAELDLVGGGSRIGINASEDLGNGMKVAYWHEWSIATTDGFNPGNNTNNFGHRDNVLSLSGSFGKVFLANAASPYKALSAGKFDFFGDTVADVNDNGYLVQPAGPAIGYGNNFGDIGVTVVHAMPDARAGGTPVPEDASGNIGNLTYNSGPLFLGAAFGSFDDAIGPADSAWIAGGIYTMDAMTFMAAYQNLSGEGHGDTDSNTWTLGAKFGFGSNTILAQYSNYDNSDADVQATLMAIGFEHAMSKNLTLGVHYGTESVDDGTDDEDFSGWDAGASFKF